MTLDFFDKFTLGRPQMKKSMLGTDFAIFPDAVIEVRSCLLPLSWYVAPTRSREKHMERTKRGWLYWTTRAQLAQEVADTIDQIDTGYGTVSVVRVMTLQRLVERHEWEEAEEIVAAHRVPT